MDQSPQTPVGQNYTVVDLGTLGGNYSYAYGINNNGQVVGDAYTSGNAADHAFLYSGGVMQDIGVLLSDSTSSGAIAINDLGQVVGGAQVNYGASSYSFLYYNGSMQNLGAFHANGINNLGQMIGGSGDGHAVIYSNGSTQDLGTLGLPYGINDAYAGINMSGQFAGSFFTNNNTYSVWRAYLYSGGVAQDLGTLGGDYSQAFGINNSGQVVGYASTTTAYHAFLYSGNVMQDIDGMTNRSSVGDGINDLGQIVGAYNLNYGPSHAFLYSNGSINDLNDMVINSSGWTLIEAYAINDIGQIVGYGIHTNKTHAFLLNPLPVGSVQACTNSQTSTPTYGNLPMQENGKDSIIVITHGWTSKEAYPIYPPDPTWVDDMSNSISQRLAGDDQTNWQVFGYKWVTNSWTLDPDVALTVAEAEGVSLGNCLSTQHWANVHLIGHSAGAGVIEVASEILKTNSPTTTVQCTFLDAFVGFNNAGYTNYGKAATWSDSYYSRDVETGSTTEGSLTNAYNVDVTQLDTNDQFKLNFYISTPSGPFELYQCQKTESTHGWPIDFYSNTITGNVSSDYDNFGYPLSIEGGFFSVAETTYYEGNNPAQVLGTPDPSCSQNPTFSKVANYTTFIDFGTYEIWRSLTGQNVPGDGYIQMINGSPVWFATLVTPTNAVNLLSFDAVFMSAEGAHGLLSVYWDANMIGLVDEAAVQPGLQHYSMSFPIAAANTSHVLGLHMDPFTSVHSVILLTNVVVGSAGVTQPFSLAFTTNTVSGLPVLQLTGQSGFNYTIQASADLTSGNWTNIAILANTNGTVPFVDPDSTNYGMRFYRVMVPQ